MCGASLLQHLLPDGRTDHGSAASKVSQLLVEIFPMCSSTVPGRRRSTTIVRLVRYYWQAKGEPKRSVIISRVNGYHGSTIAGASLGGMKHMHDQGGPWVPGIEHVMQPYSFGEGFGEIPPPSRRAPPTP